MSPSLTPALTPAASESNLGAAGTGGARAESVSAPPSVLSSPASKVYYCYCYCYYYYSYYCYCYCYYYYNLVFTIITIINYFIFFIVII